MAKKYFVVIVLLLGLAVAISFSGETIVKNSEVAVDSFTVTLALPIYLPRKDVVFANTDSTYTMYVATFPITFAEVDAGANAFPVFPLSYYHDKFHVYKSSWYVTGSTPTAAITGKLHIMEKE